MRMNLNLDDFDVEFDEPLDKYGTVFELVEGTDGKRYRPPKSRRSESYDLELDEVEDETSRRPGQFG